jgi:hypothetical protein
MPLLKAVQTRHLVHYTLRKIEIYSDGLKQKQLHLMIIMAWYWWNCDCKNSIF